MVAGHDGVTWSGSAAGVTTQLHNATIWIETPAREGTEKRETQCEQGGPGELDAVLGKHESRSFKIGHRTIRRKMDLRTVGCRVGRHQSGNSSCFRAVLHLQRSGSSYGNRFWQRRGGRRNRSRRFRARRSQSLLRLRTAADTAADILLDDVFGGRCRRLDDVLGGRCRRCRFGLCVRVGHGQRLMRLRIRTLPFSSPAFAPCFRWHPSAKIGCGQER